MCAVARENKIFAEKSLEHFLDQRVLQQVTKNLPLVDQYLDPTIGRPGGVVLPREEVSWPGLRRHLSISETQITLAFGRSLFQKARSQRRHSAWAQRIGHYTKAVAGQISPCFVQVLGRCYRPDFRSVSNAQRPRRFDTPYCELRTAGVQA